MREAEVMAYSRLQNPRAPTPQPTSDEIHLVIDNKWGSSGQVCVRQAKPLPVTIVSMALGTAIGG